MTPFKTLLAWSIVIAPLGASTVKAQTTPPSAGTAASRLRLVAPEAQPTITSGQPSAPAALAQPGAVTQPSTPPLNPPVSAPRRNNDPTMPDAVIRDLLGDARPDAPSPVPSFPDIRLRARIIVEGKPATALIEIGGPTARVQTVQTSPIPDVNGRRAYRPTAPQPTGIFRTVREGDEFVIPMGDSTSPIRVTKLTADEVIVEVVNRKTLIRLD
jgi:hypothetical protein